MTITIVLGHQLEPGGKLDPIGEARLQHLLRLEKRRPSDLVILSGGVKPWISKKSEAEMMARYLHRHGFPREKLLLEQGSLTTGMNLLFCIPNVLRYHPGCIRILSSREHLLRPLLNPIIMTRLLMLAHPEITTNFSGC